MSLKRKIALPRFREGSELERGWIVDRLEEDYLTAVLILDADEGANFLLNQEVERAVEQEHAVHDGDAIKHE